MPKHDVSEKDNVKTVRVKYSGCDRRRSSILEVEDLQGFLTNKQDSENQELHPEYLANLKRIEEQGKKPEVTETSSSRKKKFTPVGGNKPGELALEAPNNAVKIALERVKLRLCKDFKIKTNVDFRILGFHKLENGEVEQGTRAFRIFMKVKLDERETCHIAVDQEITSQTGSLGRYSLHDIKFGESDKTAMKPF